jgi:CRP/FNR family cyclic AMP-dependent transcriptional regulator
MKIQTDQRFSQEQENVYDHGEVIFKEGEQGRELYLIQEGAVEIFKETPRGRIKLAEFIKGDFFGDMALLQSIPRYAAATAKGKTKLLILQPGGFLLKIRRDPTLAFEMLQQLSHRVKVSNERLLELMQQSSMSPEQMNEILTKLDGRPK